MERLERYAGSSFETEYYPELIGSSQGAMLEAEESACFDKKDEVLSLLRLFEICPDF